MLSYINERNVERMIDAKNAEITRKINGDYTLSFIAIDEPDLLEELIVICEGQKYRIKQLSSTMSGNKTLQSVTCKHISFDLIDYYAYDYLTNTVTLDKALQFLFKDTPFTYSISDSIKNQSFEKLGECNKQKLLAKIIEAYGLEYEVDNYHFTFKKKVGYETEFQFRYKANISNVKKDIDTTSLTTYIKGYGKKDDEGNYLCTAEYTSPNAEKFGVRHADPVFDERFTIQSELLEYIKTKINDTPDIVVELDYTQIDSTQPINLGDYGYLIHEPLQLDLLSRVIEITKKLSTDRQGNNYQNMTYKIGSQKLVKSSFETSKDSITGNIDTGSLDIEIPDIDYDRIQAEIEAGKQEATDKINSGLGGYVTKTRNELLIMDTEDKATARNLWRWNINGLGFSSNGYSGPYATAITNDGKINADRILVGTIDGALIRANTIKANSLEISTVQKINSAITADDATAIMNTRLEVYDGNIKTHINTVTESKKTEAINSANQNTTSAINSAKTELNQNINTAKSDLTSKINLKANASDVYGKSEVYTKTQTDSAIKQSKDNISLEVSNKYETKVDAEAKINNLQIGGRNYLRNTGSSTDTIFVTSAYQSTSRVQVTRNKSEMKLTVTGQSGEVYYRFMHPEQTKLWGLTAGQTYVLSGKIRGSLSGDGSVSVRYQYSRGSSWVADNIIQNTPILQKTSTEYKDFEVLLPIPKEATGVYISFQLYSVNINDYIEVDKLILENGTKKSDWSPAPEDVNSLIDTAAINAINSANQNTATVIANYYTKSETDSKISVAKDEINLGVSNKYETKANVETKVTSTLNSAKSYADTKKTEAINSAASDATSKVNAAKSELNTAIGKKANTVDVYSKAEVYTKGQTDSAIKVAKDEINLGVSNTYETKANVETKITSIQVGGTNLAYDTNKGATGWGWGIQTNNGKTISGQVIDGINVVKMIKDGTSGSGWNYVNYGRFKRNKITPATTYMASFEIKSNTSFNVGSINLMQGDSTNSLVKTITAVQNKVTANSTSWNKIVFKLTTLDTLPSSTSQVIYITGIPATANATHYIRNLKLEEGNKATAWSPAPEDITTDITTAKNDAISSASTDAANKANNAKNEAINSANATLTSTIANYYTKSQTDSQIKVAKDEINLGVSNTYETKANVETKVSSTLNSAKSYADTKKTEAINAASTDATNKANNAKTEAINSAKNTLNSTIANYYTKSQTDSQINVAKEAITQSVSSTYETKTEVTNKINAVQVGTRNLARPTSGDWASRTNFNGGENQTWYPSKIYLDTLSVGDEVTYSFDIEYSGITVNNGASTFRLTLQGSGNSTGWTTALPGKGVSLNIGSGSTRISQTFKLTSEQKKNSYFEFGFRTDYVNGGTIKYRCGMASKGNKVVQWSPAPEDITTNINNAKTDAINAAATDAANKVNSAKNELNTAINKKANSADVYKKTEVYTKNETNSQITTAKNEINQSVSNTYETKTNVTTKINGVNNSISSLTTRMTNAESKITDTAITNTVKKNFYTKEETNNQITSKGYQTSSQVQQTVDNLQIKFTQSGGYNLLLNSGFKKNMSYWGTHTHNSPTGGSIGRLTSADQWGFPDSAVNCACIRLSNQSGIEYGISQVVKTTIGKKYTISFYYAGHRLNQANVIVRNSSGGTWVANKYINSFPSGGNGNVNNWSKCVLTFTANATSHAINIVINNAGNDGYMWIAKPQVVEGELDLPYSPNPNEVYDGLTTIDKDGIKVSTSNGAYTQFSSDGMSSFNNSSQQTLGIKNGGITFHPYSSSQLGAYITQSALWGGNASANGLAISTANNGTYIALGTSSLSDANTTLNMDQALTISANDSFQPRGINFWKDVHAHGYGIRQLSHLKLAGSGAIQFDYLNNSPSTIYEAVDSGHSLYVMGGYQMHLGCMDGKGVPKGVIWMKSSTDTHSYTHWDFHNYTMYNMKTASSFINTASHRATESYGVTSNVDGVRYLYRDVELIEGKAIRSIPNGYRGCTYDIVSIVCKGRGSAWVETEDENRFEINGDCKSVNIEIIIYPSEDVMAASTQQLEEPPTLELPKKTEPEKALLITNEVDLDYMMYKHQEKKNK